MTNLQTQTVQRGAEIAVPLNRLKPSPRNARRTPHAASDIEALAASIAAKGLLQPPVVEPERREDGRETGAYLVTIGEGRRQALRLLAKRKQLSASTSIRCLLDAANDAFEISLDENVTRFAMHPADQFEAFRDLAETKGWSAEEIAARFGVSAQTVRQRLRLGAVSPRLLAAYRAEDLSLDQLMAFALSEDHARQEQVYDGLAYNRSPTFIRRALTERELPADDRRAAFVGAEAYTAAGGRIRRDLFAEDRGGWFEDVGVAERLCLDRLAAEAERVRTEEGWAWAEAHLDHPHGHGLSRVYPRTPEPDPETAARLADLSEEYDRLIESLTEDEPTPEMVTARLAEIDAELRAAAEPVYDADTKARAGLFAVLDWQGGLRIERGLVRLEDEPVVEPQEAEGSTEEAATPKAPGGPKPLPDRLVADLTAHRTAALRDLLGGNPEAAFLAALHALVQATFCDGWRTGCLRLTVDHRRLDGLAEAYADSAAARSLEARHAGWAARLPQDPDATWTTLLALSIEDRRALFAHCVSLTLDAVQATEGQSRPGADDLAAHLALDMTRYWRATADSYFGRVSKAQMLAALEEVKPEAVERLRGLKKEAMADAVADLLGADGWLPPLLRPAAAGPA